MTEKLLTGMLSLNTNKQKCMFGRIIGAEGSVSQELCHFVILTIDVCIMTDSTYFVNSNPLRAFTGSFQYFADMLQTY